MTVYCSKDSQTRALWAKRGERARARTAQTLFALWVPAIYLPLGLNNSHSLTCHALASLLGSLFSPAIPLRGHLCAKRIINIWWPSHKRERASRSVSLPCVCVWFHLQTQIQLGRRCEGRLWKHSNPIALIFHVRGAALG